MSNLFKPVKEGSFSSRASDAIRKAILSGKVPAGETPRGTTSKGFSGKPDSVREALFNLEQFGLVRRLPNKGTFVTKLSPEDLRERLEIRMLLEELAAVQAARRMKKEHYVELRKRGEAVSTGISNNDHFEMALADQAYHRSIWENSGNKLLYQTLDQVLAPTFAFATIMRSVRQDNLNRVVHSHHKILSPLRRGEPEAVRNTIRTHLNPSNKGVLVRM